MSIHLTQAKPSLDILRQRQLLPYIKSRPAPSTYSDAIDATVGSFSDAKRILDWFFDVAGFQSSAVDKEGIPSLEERKKLYVFEDDGTFPPHLQVIPPEDVVGRGSIFKFTRLFDTIVLMFHPFVPDIRHIGQLGPDGQQTMQALEARNAELHDDASSRLIYRRNMFTAANIGLRPDWYSDAVFAQQSFTGTNPSSITVATDDWMKTFSMAAQGNAAVLLLMQTSPAGSFYVQDYSYFRKAAGLAPTEDITSITYSSEHIGEPKQATQKFGCASVVLYYLPPTGELHPLAIILDWKGSLAASVTIFNKRVLPTDPTGDEATDWPWRYAKMCAQVSDWFRHEVTAHLTDTHFVEEVTLVAAQRSFPSDHPVYRLLRNHWNTTLSINALARSTLVPKVVIPLSAFSEAQIVHYVNHEYENFDWTGKYVPNDLNKRGFPTSDIQTSPKYHNYGYGRDISLMWNTIRKFVSTVLTAFYVGGDRQVQRDTWVATFCQEMRSPAGGNMSQFPTVTTLDGLIDMTTMCIHIAAPQHTAVNYLQQYYMTFVPNKPSALYRPLPETIDALNQFTEKDLIDSLPVKPGQQERDWLLMGQVPYLLNPAVEEDISLTTFAKHAAEDDDPVIARAGEALVADLADLAMDMKAVSIQLDDQEREYDVLYPDETAKAIVI